MAHPGQGVVFLAMPALGLGPNLARAAVTSVAGLLTLITGHPRSGTTLLGHLCHSHPHGHFTQELGLFRGVWLPYHLYVLVLLDGWRKRNLPAFFRPGEKLNWWPSRRFLWQLIRGLARYRQGPIGPAELLACYREIVPGARAMGDKLPNYSLQLDAYARVPELRCVVIYRHVFGVVRSYIKQIRGEWKGVASLSRLSTPEAIAAQWAGSVRQLMRHREQVLSLSYESLLADPETELARLGTWLQLDPDGFDRTMLKAPLGPPSLEPAVESHILEICGDELAELGYH